MNTTQGEVTVNISSNTSIQKIIAGTLDDLQTGQFLTITGTADAEGNITASSITVGSPDQNFPFTPPGGASSNSTGRFNGSNNGSNTRPSNGNLRNGSFGTLVKIDGNILTLTTAQGQQMMVTVSSNTTIEKNVSGIIADLQVGETLTVIGPRDVDGNVNAVSILIHPQG
jgi:cytoskeletal protein CcmA (bactofilin family)